MIRPRFRVPSKWGLCFDGNEEAFCAALDLAIDSTKERPFRYLEIGLGYGDGMRAVQSYLIQTRVECQFVGVDIATCHPSASDASRYVFPGMTRIFLCGAEKYLQEHAEPLSFAFIDGCHGAPCVESDFLAIEPRIVAGGCVVFHDTDPGCQGIHYQPHCDSGIEARAAIAKLGLLDNKRSAWKMVAETTGDKSAAGHGLAIFQKL